MNWKLSQHIMDAMPHWQRQNQLHALARHLLSLAHPPTDEQACYEWLEREVNLAYQYGLSELNHLRPAIEALFLAQTSFDNPEVRAIVDRVGLPSGRVMMLVQWAMSQQVILPEAIAPQGIAQQFTSKEVDNELQR